MSDYDVGHIIEDFDGVFTAPQPPLLDYVYVNQLTSLVGPSFAGKSWFTLWTAFLLREQGISSLIISTEAARKSEWHFRAKHLATLFPACDVPVIYAPMPYGGLGEEDGARVLIEKVTAVTNDLDYVFLDSVGSATGRTPSNEEAARLVRTLESVIDGVGASGGLVIGHDTLASQERPSEFGAGRGRQLGGQTYEAQFGVVMSFQRTKKTKDVDGRTFRTLSIRSNITGPTSLDFELTFVKHDGQGLMVGLDRVGLTLADLLKQALIESDPDHRGIDYRTLSSNRALTPKRLASSAKDWEGTVRSTLNRHDDVFTHLGSGMYRLVAGR